jgi:hypothetical protein
MADLSIGDRVSWGTSQGRTQGKITKKHTKDFDFDGQHFKASSDEPAFEVESEKSGKSAAHKATALKKLKDKKD